MSTRHFVLGLALLGGGLCFYSAVHNFIFFGARSKANEVRTNLTLLCEKQRALIAEGKPATTYRELVRLEEGNRFTYFLASGGTFQLRDKRPIVEDPLATGLQVDRFKYVGQRLASEADLPPRLAGGLHLGQNGDCWVYAAVGNIDADPDLDAWSVATCVRTEPGHDPIPACTPFHDRNELPGAWDFLKR